MKEILPRGKWVMLTKRILGSDWSGNRCSRPSITFSAQLKRKYPRAHPAERRLTIFVNSIKRVMRTITIIFDVVAKLVNGQCPSLVCVHCYFCAETIKKKRHPSSTQNIIQDYFVLLYIPEMNISSLLQQEKV